MVVFCVDNFKRFPDFAADPREVLKDQKSRACRGRHLDGAFFLGSKTEGEAVTDQIKTNANLPKRVKGDEGEMEQHSIPDQIAADKYDAAKTAVVKKHRGLRFTKLRAGGAE
jgi:hypothetical protein